MAGGARRDVLTGVVDADWIPGTDALAVIRDPGGRPSLDRRVSSWNDGPRSSCRVVAARLARREPGGVLRGPGGVRQCARGDDHGHRQVRPHVHPLARPGRLSDWPGRHRETRSGSRRRAPANTRRTCVPSRFRGSSAPCTARRTGSCCTTSPRTAGCCCLETRFASA